MKTHTLKKIQFLFVFSVVIIVSGCASTLLKVVDPDGKPIQGALVLTQRPPYILQKWKIGLAISDKKGDVPIVTNLGYIFKKGYYPYIVSSCVSSSYYKSNYMGQHRLEKEITLYPINEVNTPEVKIESKTYPYDDKSQKQDLAIKTCPGVSVFHDFSNNMYTVTSKADNLIESKRYFFVGPTDHHLKGPISKKSEIYFYCKGKDSKFLKVGIGTNQEGAYSSQRFHGIVVLKSQLDGVDQIIEPKIKTIPKYEYVYDNNKMKPDVFTNSDADNLINALRTNFPEKDAREIQFRNEWLKIVRKYVK